MAGRVGYLHDSRDYCKPYLEFRNTEAFEYAFEYLEPFIMLCEFHEVCGHFRIQTTVHM